MIIKLRKETQVLREKVTSSLWGFRVGRVKRIPFLEFIAKWRVVSLELCVIK